MSVRHQFGVSKSSAPTRGFTMMELLITISIVAILTALAFPSYREFTIRMAVSDATNGLVHALNLARTEAVKRGRIVFVEPVSANWSNGWIVRCEACAPAADPSDPLIDEEIFRLEKSNDYAVTALEASLQFTRAGTLAGNASSFRICRPASSVNAAENRLVEVRISGVISSRRRGPADPAVNAPPACS